MLMEESNEQTVIEFDEVKTKKLKWNKPVKVFRVTAALGGLDQRCGGSDRVCVNENISVTFRSITRDLGQFHKLLWAWANLKVWPEEHWPLLKSNKLLRSHCPVQAPGRFVQAQTFLEWKLLIKFKTRPEILWCITKNQANIVTKKLFLILCLLK